MGKDLSSGDFRLNVVCAKNAYLRREVEDQGGSRDFLAVLVCVARHNHVDIYIDSRASVANFAINA